VEKLVLRNVLTIAKEGFHKENDALNPNVIYKTTSSKEKV
jgi:hypothetical protein